VGRQAVKRHRQPETLSNLGGGYFIHLITQGVCPYISEFGSKDSPIILTEYRSCDQPKAALTKYGELEKFEQNRRNLIFFRLRQARYKPEPPALKYDLPNLT
jgi:hypothetical protein